MRNKKQRELQERKERVEKEKAEKEKQDEEERIRVEEASKYVKLSVRRFHTLESSSPLVSMYYRSKLIQGIKWVTKADSNTGSWGDYVPTSQFLKAVEEIMKRHANKELMKQNSTNNKSNTSNVVLDENGLKSFLSYNNLGDKADYQADIAVLQKHAGLPTGLDVSFVIQFFGKLIGANETIYEGEQPSTVRSPIWPAHTRGCLDVIDWLLAAGYDHHVYHNTYLDESKAIASQSPAVWSKSSLEPLMAWYHEAADKCGEDSITQMKATQIRLTEADRTRLGLPDLPLPCYRLRLIFLKWFNRLFANLLPLIDLRRTSEFNSIAGLVKACRPAIATAIKNQFFQSILDATAEDSKPPRVEVNRIALAQAKQRGEHTDFTKHSLFGLTFQQLRTIDPFNLRPVRPHGTEPFLAFEAVFRGEHVVGEGGPFREIFSQMGKELAEDSPLFIPCPNKEHKIGENRDKVIIKPSSTSSIHLQLFEHLGLLFGCSLRTGVRFPLPLPAFVWKPLVGDQLTTSDLAAVDFSAVESLKFIESCPIETLDQTLHQNFTTKLSDGTVVELKENGTSIQVNAENRQEYVGLVLAARLTEHTSAIEAIRRGISKIVPIQLLNMLTARDLELLICGNSFIDIDLLRRHTKYSGVSPDAPHIDMFWRVLEDFDQAHRRLFIKFAWAQEALPSDDAEFIRTHTRFLIKASSQSNPDKSLPKSDTCFFNLMLPAYSTEDIMKERLVYAVTSCSSMDADNDVEDIHERRGGRRGFGGEE